MIGRLRLPSRAAGPGAAEQLFVNTRDAIRHHARLPAETATLLVHWCLSTWFPECLWIAPCLAITTAVAADAIFMLRLLSCFCRGSLILSDVSPLLLFSLADLHPTLLICNWQIAAKTQKLLNSTCFRGISVPVNAGLAETFGPKAVAGTTSADWLENAIQVALPPGRSLGLVPGGEDHLLDDLAEAFQPRLLRYRFDNFRSVAGSNFDVPRFTSPTREIARSLGACVPDDELRHGLIELLAEQDEQVRVERQMDSRSITLEALLVACHERGTRSIRVGEIAKLVNGILTGRGEREELKPRAVGSLLRDLGLYTRRLGSAGRGLDLSQSKRATIHRLAQAYEVPSLQSRAARCDHCREVPDP